jgi:outer membrane lipoprotein-sorting protein
MSGVPKLSRRGRWAVPVGALVVTGAVMAGSLMSGAQAAPSLPARTPAQLLAAVGQDQGPALYGSVLETASLGLPSLPGNSSNPTSITSLLTGSHTVNVWYASPERYRLALPASLSETDVIRNGSTVWLWQSTANAVTEISVPADKAKYKPTPMTTPALTPQQAANQVLAAVGPTTAVSVDSNVVVAGQAAYELVVAPKDARSLVGQIRIAVDGHNGVPLRVQVFARGASNPAISVGFTSVTFATPAPADTSFTPPADAKITKENPGQEPKPGGQPNETGITTIGSGWLAVLDLPSSALTAGSAGPRPGPPNVPMNGASGESAAALRALIGSATVEHGAWGTGRLLRTSLISVLITDSGSTFVGAVQPSVLYAAATTAATAPSPATTP